MKINIDREKCIGCGLCEAVAGDVFILNNGIAELVPDVDLSISENVKNAKSAAEMCSQEAIVITDD